MQIFTIDANIGAGKTTILEYLHKVYHVPIDPEPVRAWEPFLHDMYYHNKGAFEFQVRVWLDRCWIQQRPNMAPIVMERSPFMQQNVFIPINMDMQRLTLREFQMLNEMYNRSAALWSPSGYIYLRSKPEKCFDRMKRRDRASEQVVSQEYLELLHAHHERAYMMAVIQGIPMIVIDVEEKSVPQIAHEVWNALCFLGMNTSMLFK